MNYFNGFGSAFSVLKETLMGIFEKAESRDGKGGWAKLTDSGSNQLDYYKGDGNGHSHEWLTHSEEEGSHPYQTNN